LPYYVRLMRREDIAQVAEIDREAFPTQLPPPNFQHELRNRLAHYIVACDEEKLVEQPTVKASSGNSLTRLASRLRQLFGHDRSSSDNPSPSMGNYITGFVGFWVMADEAHITSIAVREAYRRQGIGELLLLAAIDRAVELKARIVTLEVRASNTAAQNLYLRYGFTQVGVRRGYYTDNREDALVMSTEDISSAAFQRRFRQLRTALVKKPGIADYQIAR
jgi:ribosomal-protein-alanine N-acetyltransferase